MSDELRCVTRFVDETGYPVPYYTLPSFMDLPATATVWRIEFDEQGTLAVQVVTLVPR